MCCSVLHFPPREPSKPAYDVVAILDPATRAAQKYTPLIMVGVEQTATAIAFGADSDDTFCYIDMEIYVY